MHLPATLVILLSGIAATPLVADVAFPGSATGEARSANQETTWSLENKVISASWTFQNNQLRPSELVNRPNKQSLPQRDRDLFRFAVARDTPDADGETQTWLGIKWSNDNLIVQTSTNGRGWRTISTEPRSGFSGSPTLLRFGKMDKKGGLSDYPDTGTMGTPRFDNLAVVGISKRFFTEEFTAPTIPASWAQHLTPASGRTAAVADGWLALRCPANCAAFLERPLPAEATQITCRIDQADDQAQSWGPGLALVWPDGRALVVNIRKEGACSVIADGSEQIIGSPFQAVPDYNLTASGFKVFEGPKLIDLPAKPKNPRGASHSAGKAILAKLRDERSGLTVMWRAVLRDGSSYIREEITLMTSGPPVALTGVQLLDGRHPRPRSLAVCRAARWLPAIGSSAPKSRFSQVRSPAMNFPARFPASIGWSPDKPSRSPRWPAWSRPVGHTARHTNARLVDAGFRPCRDFPTDRRPSGQSGTAL